MKTTLQDIIDIVRYFADNQADVQTFKFARPGEQALQLDQQPGSEVYPMMHLHQPVFQQVTSPQQGSNSSDRFQINVAFHELMDQNTDLDVREQQQSVLHDIANQFVAYMTQFERIRADRGLNIGPAYLNVVGESSIVTESYERSDVTLMTLVTINIETFYSANYCDINWIV